MKLDDRDIVCEQDYTPLSNAELVAHIERYAGLMHSTPLSDGEWLDDIIGPARVLLARAEAAEARAAELAETLENIICALGLNPVDYSDELTEPLITGVIAAMQQRAAELEAALDAAERERDDANDWQPVDTVPLETDVLLILRGQVFGQPGRQWVLATDEPFFCWRSV